MTDSYDADHVIVLQPGSHLFRYGLARDQRPRSIHNVVAYRTSTASRPTTSPPAPPNSLSRQDLATVTQRRQQEVKEAQSSFKKRYRAKYQALRSAVANNFFNTAVDPVYNESNCQKVLERDLADQHRFVFCDTTRSPRKVIGDDALHLAPDAGYILRYPIVRGRISSQPGHTTHSSLDVLYDVIDHVIFHELKIERAHIQQYAISLAVSDMMGYREVIDLHDLLFNKIGIGAIFVHRESVLACLGAGVSTCCVVDIGKHKTHVCCIKEGVIIPESCYMARFGGQSITDLFLFLLNACSGNIEGFDLEHYFPYPLNLNNLQDGLVVEALKIRVCAFAPSTIEDVELNQAHEFYVTDPQSRTVTQYRLNITQARYLAPLCMFQSGLLGPDAYFDVRGPLSFIERDLRPFDYLCKSFMDSAPSISGRAKDLAKKSGMDESQATAAPAVEPAVTDMDERDVPTNQDNGVENEGEKGDEISVDVLPMSLHDMVAASVAAIQDVELRRTLLSQILVVGGPAKTQGFVDEFEDRLIDTVSMYLTDTDRIEVIQNPKELDLGELSWVGAAIVAPTTSCWVQRNEWTGGAFGSHTHLLRARIPFAWDS